MKKQIKAMAPLYHELQQKAFAQKDPGLYAYATGVLFLINNIETLPGDCFTYDVTLQSQILNGPLSTVDPDVLTSLYKLCEEAKGADLTIIPGRTDNVFVIDGVQVQGNILGLLEFVRKLLANQKRAEEVLFS